MRVIARTFTSSLTIVEEHNIVIKTIIPHKEILFGVAERQTHWLEILKDSYIVPQLLYVNGVVIVMDYVGEVLTATNTPIDFEKQLNYILEVLESYDCCHNDIRPENLCVKDKYIYIIDFEWATSKGEKVPNRWPSKLGSVFKGDQGFNDAHSIKKVIGWINQGQEKLKQEIPT